MKLHNAPMLSKGGMSPDTTRHIIATVGDEAVLQDTIRGYREVWRRGMGPVVRFIDGNPYVRKEVVR